MSESFLNGRVVLHCGDSREIMRTLADNSVHAFVGDPPYALVSIQKRFGKPGSAPVKVGDVNASSDLKAAYARASAGFMGKNWDTGETAFDPAFWAECLRVLKPGGFVVMASGTRTYHQLATAIETAGFEVRDSILEMFASTLAGDAFLDSLNNEQRSAFIRLLDEQSATGLLGWAYGSGFPKSHDVSKGLGRMLAGPSLRNQWEGWGTALKPAWEPIVLARKPLSEGTVAANVLRWRTGALNIDASRVPMNGEIVRCTQGGKDGGGFDIGSSNSTRHDSYESHASGRWPANVIHDGSEEVLAAFPEAPGQQFYVGPEHGDRPSRGIYGDFGARPANEPRGDSGSAARFFYTAKADADDRLGSKHPTVKPVDLMQWLCRLVTPKNGTILDPFAGTGSTAEAAFREGFNCILIEREEEYQNDIRRRMALVMAGPDERARESIKAKLADKPIDAGPLFAGAAE